MRSNRTFLMNAEPDISNLRRHGIAHCRSAYRMDTDLPPTARARLPRKAFQEVDSERAPLCQHIVRLAMSEANIAAFSAGNAAWNFSAASLDSQD